MWPLFASQLSLNSSSSTTQVLEKSVLESCMAINLGSPRNSFILNQFLTLIYSLGIFALSLLFILYQSLVNNKASDL
jgi:hypothetical protein